MNLINLIKSIFISNGIISNGILKEIEEDFKLYPDLNKIDITIDEATNNKYQLQFDDFLQFNYTFGNFHKKKNTPLGPYTYKRITINHVPGHIIYIYTNFDRLVGKKKFQKNSSEIIVRTGSTESYHKIKFKEAGEFIRDQIQIYLKEYPKLEKCKRLNYRGILDIENNIDPIIGFIKGISYDSLDYTYPYRNNENPEKLFNEFKYINRKEIEQKLKDRDINLYKPVWKKEANRVKNIEHILVKYLKPLEKYCNLMFGIQRYIFEHNDTDKEIKITYLISNKDKFGEKLHEISNEISNEFKLIDVEYQEPNILWGVIKFIYL